MRRKRPLSRVRSHVRTAHAVLQTRQEEPMLFTIAVILLVLWLLGLVSGYTLGNFIYVLLCDRDRPVRGRAGQRTSHRVAADGCRSRRDPPDRLTPGRRPARWLAFRPVRQKHRRDF